MEEDPQFKIIGSYAHPKATYNIDPPISPRKRIFPHPDDITELHRYGDWVRKVSKDDDDPMYWEYHKIGKYKRISEIQLPSIQVLEEHEEEAIEEEDEEEHLEEGDYYDETALMELSKQAIREYEQENLLQGSIETDESDDEHHFLQDEQEWQDIYDADEEYQF